ncbi:unnamed protein product [Dicrocoelium dendriticum]|nr:unnamed protein product [Dicrocoelium dendriticum]
MSTRVGRDASVWTDVIARILLNRLVSQVVEPNVAEEPCGFRSGRSTIDMVFSARRLQQKCRERHQPLYSLFVDFTKAFDTVNREALSLVLGKFGFPRKSVRLIECLHSGMRARVQLSGETSDDFAVVTVVKQGCVLAPALFNIYLHAMLSCAFDAACAYGVRVEHRIDGGLLNVRRFGARTLVCDTAIRMLLFADDCALFSHSADELQYMTSVLASTSAKFALIINTSETVCLFQPSPEVQSTMLPQISIDDEVLETTSRFCYLGSVMSTDPQLHSELRIRVSKAAAAFGKQEYRVGNNHQLTVGTKVMVYKSIVLRSWESKAADRRAWRDLIPKAVAEVQEKALMHAEKKRKAPMGCSPSTSSAWCCSTCGRECLSQAGLVSHERRHSGPLPKRRRVLQTT